MTDKKWKWNEIRSPSVNCFVHKIWPIPKQKMREVAKLSPTKSHICSRNNAKSSNKSWETALHSTKREQWLPLAAWLALSGFGFQFLSLISTFSILVGRAVFPFVNICFFIARKSVSGFPQLLCWLRSTKVQINILTIYKIFWKIEWDLSICIFFYTDFCDFSLFVDFQCSSLFSLISFSIKCFIVSRGD